MKRMKIVSALTVVLCFMIGLLSACTNTTTSGTTNNDNNGTDLSGGTRIEMRFDGQTIYGTLNDNSVSRDLISRLPLTLEFSDYNGIEKIAYLPDGAPDWDLSAAPNSCTPSAGDIAMYSPWGNISLFYHDFRQSNGLVPLGKLDGGEIEKLSAMNGTFEVTIALIEGDSAENPDQSDGDTPPTDETPDVPDVPGIPDTPQDKDNILIAYFSATNNTQSIANHIASVTGGTLYEIIPAIPYTSADLNYGNSDCRANREQNDPACRPEITGSVENMEDYDIVFIGYPIWWGQAPKIIYTFLESYDFEDKTIVTFCTSGSSGIGTSSINLHSSAPAATWKDGQRFSGSASKSTIESWIDGLNLNIQKQEMKISVKNGNIEIVYQLNDSKAAKDLYAQLPLTVAVQPFSNNEIIFYPETLDTSDAPLAEGGAGSLAYYAPWGDVVLFYGSFNQNSSLFELGKIVLGIENIKNLSGTVTISAC